MQLFCPHQLHAVLQNGAVWLCFEQGLADSVTLLSRRGPEPEFSVLMEDQSGVVIDNRPKLCPEGPEIRHYRVILRYSSWESCRFTNEVELTVP